MIKVLVKDAVKRFKPSSLGQSYLDKLAGTDTLARFEESGADVWASYWADMPEAYGEEQDAYKIMFFTKQLGADLYSRITKANDYEAAFVVQNAWAAWGRANVDDVTSVRLEE